MIAYFDTSAFLKLIIAEPGSTSVERAWRSASSITSGRVLYPEARAGLASALRGGRVPGPYRHGSRSRLDELWADCVVVDLTPVVAAAAGDVAEHHALRGYDAVHLTSALRASAEVFVCADVDLLRAARAEGLAVVDVRA